MPKHNYQIEKRQRELQKKQRKIGKAEKKAAADLLKTTDTPTTPKEK